MRTLQEGIRKVPRTPGQRKKKRIGKSLLQRQPSKVTRNRTKKKGNGERGQELPRNRGRGGGKGGKDSCSQDSKKKKVFQRFLNGFCR